MNSQESSPIKIVLFPNYNEAMRIKKLDYSEGTQKLSKFGLIRKSDIDPKELEQTSMDLSQRKFEGVDFLEVGFSNIKNLKRAGFRI